MTPAFEASDGDALALQLETNGKTAPYRLERRGRQKERERWILARFLERQAARDHLGFPLEVFESEAPDFLIICNARRYPVEIVEACDPSEQIEWTRRAKIEEQLDTPSMHDIDVENPARPCQFKEIACRAISLKAKKHYGSDVSLVIYPDTDCQGFETDDWKTSALGNLRSETSKFARVWMPGDESILDLGGAVKDAPL